MPPSRLVEVNPQGRLVRTYTFPPGWGIYRVEDITAQNWLVGPSISTRTNEEPTLIVAVAVSVVVVLAVATFYLKRKTRKPI